MLSAPPMRDARAPPLGPQVLSMALGRVGGGMRFIDEYEPIIIGI